MTREEMIEKGYMSDSGVPNRLAPAEALLEMFFQFMGDVKWINEKEREEARLNVMGAKAHPGLVCIHDTSYKDPSGHVWVHASPSGYRRISDGLTAPRKPEDAKIYPEGVLHDWAWGKSEKSHRQIRVGELDPYYYRPEDIRRNILGAAFADYILTHRDEVEEWIRQRAVTTDRSKDSKDSGEDGKEFLKVFAIERCGMDESESRNIRGFFGRPTIALAYLLDTLGGHPGVRRIALA